KIVAIEVDVQNPHWNLQSFQALDFGREPLSQRGPAPLDSYKSEAVQVIRLLQYFVGKANQGAIDLRRAHQLLLFSNNCHGIECGGPTVTSDYHARVCRVPRVRRSGSQAPANAFR